MTFYVEDQITNLMAEKLNIGGGFQDQQVQNLSKEMDRLMVYNYQSKNDDTQEKILNTPGPKLDNEFKDLLADLADKCKSCGKSFSESEPRVPGFSKKTNESRRFIKRNKYRKWKRRTKPMKSFLNSNYLNKEMQQQQQLVVGNNLQNQTFYTGVNENNKDVSFINFNLAQGAINYENNENIGVINQFSTEHGQFDDVEALAAEICSVGLPNMPQDPNEYDQYLMHLFKNSKIMK